MKKDQKDLDRVIRSANYSMTYVPSYGRKTDAIRVTYLVTIKNHFDDITRNTNETFYMDRRMIKNATMGREVNLGNNNLFICWFAVEFNKT